MALNCSNLQIGRRNYSNHNRILYLYSAFIQGALQELTSGTMRGAKGGMVDRDGNGEGG